MRVRRLAISLLGSAFVASIAALGFSAVYAKVSGTTMSDGIAETLVVWLAVFVGQRLTALKQ